jgi:hypothetical protein
MSFGDVLEAADQLSLDEQTTLVEVLNRRIVERRRNDLAGEIQQSRQEYEAGQARPATPDEILKAILS